MFMRNTNDGLLGFLETKIKKIDLRRILLIFVGGVHLLLTYPNTLVEGYGWYGSHKAMRSILKR